MSHPEVITSIHRLAPGQIKVDCTRLPLKLAQQFWPAGRQLPSKSEEWYFTLDFSDHPFDDCVGYEQGLLGQIVEKCNSLGVHHYHSIEYPSQEDLADAFRRPSPDPLALPVLPPAKEPIPETITDRLIEDLKRRQALGVSRYGKPILAGESYEPMWLLMKLEEDIDGLVYLLAYLEEKYSEQLKTWRERGSV